MCPLIKQASSVGSRSGLSSTSCQVTNEVEYQVSLDLSLHWMCCYVKPKLRKATEVPSVQMCAAFLNVQSQNVRGIFSGTQHAATTPERRIEDHSIWTGIDQSSPPSKPSKAPQITCDHMWSYVIIFSCSCNLIQNISSQWLGIRLNASFHQLLTSGAKGKPPASNPRCLPAQGLWNKKASKTTQKFRWFTST